MAEVAVLLPIFDVMLKFLEIIPSDIHNLSPVYFLENLVTLKSILPVFKGKYENNTWWEKSRIFILVNIKNLTYRDRCHKLNNILLYIDSRKSYDENFASFIFLSFELTECRIYP